MAIRDEEEPRSRIRPPRLEDVLSIKGEAALQTAITQANTQLTADVARLSQNRPDKLTNNEGEVSRHAMVDWVKHEVTPVFFNLQRIIALSRETLPAEQRAVFLQRSIDAMQYEEAAMERDEALLKAKEPTQRQAIIQEIIATNDTAGTVLAETRDMLTLPTSSIESTTSGENAYSMGTYQRPPKTVFMNAEPGLVGLSTVAQDLYGRFPGVPEVEAYDDVQLKQMDPIMKAHPDVEMLVLSTQGGEYDTRPIEKNEVILLEDGSLVRAISVESSNDAFRGREVGGRGSEHHPNYDPRSGTVMLDDAAVTNFIRKYTQNDRPLHTVVSPSCFSASFAFDTVCKVPNIKQALGANGLLPVSLTHDFFRALPLMQAAIGDTKTAFYATIETMRAYYETIKNNSSVMEMRIQEDVSDPQLRALYKKYYVELAKQAEKNQEALSKFVFVEKIDKPTDRQMSKLYARERELVSQEERSQLENDALQLPHKIKGALRSYQQPNIKDIPSDIQTLMEKTEHFENAYRNFRQNSRKFLAKEFRAVQSELQELQAFATPFIQEAERGRERYKQVEKFKAMLRDPEITSFGIQHKMRLYERQHSVIPENIRTGFTAMQKIEEEARELVSILERKNSATEDEFNILQGYVTTIQEQGKLLKEQLM